MLVKSYLSRVYPLSDHIHPLSPEEAISFYENLRFWYRTPIEGYSDGLLSDRVQPEYGVFLVPDTVAVDARVPSDVGKGFESPRPLRGSNRDHIEISTYAWMVFPYGAYYNWAPGSGIYLSTGGRTLGGYNKVHVLQQLHPDQEEAFRARLAKNSLVHEQLVGVRRALTQEEARRIVEDPRSFLGGVKKQPHKTLLYALVSAGSWPEVLGGRSAGSPTGDEVIEALLSVYVADHLGGDYDPRTPRYAYMAREASTRLDQWLYEAAKEAGINVVQMTREPNNSGGTAFEICDTRWPEVYLEGIGSKVILEGTQPYDLGFAWRRAVSEGWYQLRDPFDLANDAKARRLEPRFPDMSPEGCHEKKDCYVVGPSEKFDRSWLPEEGWGVEACRAVGGCARGDTLGAWRRPGACPPPLRVEGEPTSPGLCRSVSWALNGEGNGLFSMTDVAANVRLLEATAGAP